MTVENDLQRASDLGAAIVANVEKVIVGKTDVVKLGVAALFSQGHVLVEGVPGVGKTMFARALAKSVGLTFRRIQCTADLLPSDVTGVYIFDQRDREFTFRPGPVLSNIVLVDEINRASPKTQSALLECMEERQTTIDGISHPMPSPFLILATRNPTEHGGTFPLPETELDRFLIRLRLDYPSPEEEVSILDNQIPIHPIDNIEPVADADEIGMAQQAARNVYADKAVKEYVVGIVNSTRIHQSIYLGASPRASLGMLSLSQSLALLEGRDYVLPDDVKTVAVEVLGHRIVLSADGRSDLTEDDAIRSILESVPVAGAAPVQGFPFAPVRRTSG